MGLDIAQRNTYYFVRCANYGLSGHYIYISGIWQTLLSKATYKEYICWRRQQYIAVVHKDKNITGLLGCLHNSWDKSRRAILSTLPTSKNIQYAKHCKVLLIMPRRTNTNTNVRARV